MSWINIELAIGFAILLAGAAVAFAVVQRRISAKNAQDRREHLKDRARKY